MEQAKCKSCGADILWVRTEANEYLIPLDPEPCEDGNIYLRDGKAVVLGRPSLFDGERPAERLYKSHFASCPNHQEWRKKRGKRT